jgi:hypothetical protein
MDGSSDSYIPCDTGGVKNGRKHSLVNGVLVSEKYWGI